MVAAYRVHSQIEGIFAEEQRRKSEEASKKK
jgi:hypothetical protein